MHIETTQKDEHKSYRCHIKCRGKKASKTFLRKIDADRWGQKMEQVYKERGHFITFEDLASEWLENHSKVKNAPATYKTYQYQVVVINSVIGNRPVAELNYDDIERVRRHVQSMGEKSNQTTNRFIGVIRAIMYYGEEKGDVFKNPVRKRHFLTTSQAPFQFWQRSEAEQFVSYVETKYADHHLAYAKLLYLIALNTGMRWGEIVALKWDSVHFGAKPYLVVRRTYCTKSRRIRETTKSNHHRYIGINGPLLAVFKNASAQKTRDCDLVMPNLSGAIVDNQNFVKRHFKPDAKAAGVPEIRFHDLRHTYASIYMMNGGNLYDLQKILGHQDAQMTMRYAHLSHEYIINKASVVNIGQSDNVIAVDFTNKQALA